MKTYVAKVKPKANWGGKSANAVYGLDNETALLFIVGEELIPARQLEYEHF